MTAMAMRIRAEERVLAALTVRFSSSAVPLGLAVERFIPKLHETAQLIRDRFSAARTAP